MKIGVWIDRDFNPKSGGAFSYYSRLVNELDLFNFNEEIELVFINQSINENKYSKKSICISSLPKIILKFFNFSPIILDLIYRLELKYLKKRLTSQLLKNDIKVIYYLKQTTCHFPDFPFIATNWDIGYLSTHSFPELNSQREFNRRDSYYKNILPRALMVFCESEASKRELLNYTNLGAHKLKIVPLFSGNVSSLSLDNQEIEKILLEYKLGKRSFFFYPAQFWAHKNHYGLLNAFSLFLKENPDFKLVLCGSDKGNKNYVKSITRDLKIEDSVIFAGFVSNNVLFTFYKSSFALIMASHFGPTNIPPIEAMEIGVPVICSDLDGHKEILGDAGVYFNSYEISSIFKSMNKLKNNRDEFKKLVVNRSKSNLFKVENSVNKIAENLSQIILIRKNWK